jgi:hypothetical protein
VVNQGDRAELPGYNQPTLQFPSFLSTAVRNMLSGNSTIGDLLAMSRQIFDGGASGLSVRLLIDAYTGDYTSVVVGAGFVGSTSTETSGNFGGAGSGGSDEDTQGPNNLVVIFPGAEFGQGPTPTAQQLAKSLKGKNTDAQVFNSTYLMDDDYNTADALAYVLNSQARDGGKILIYGYSYGGDLANYLAKRLDEHGVNVTYMAIVDGTNGPFNNVDRTVSKNVGYTDNFYQAPAIWPTGGVLHGGSLSGPNTVNNYPMKGVDHMNIDDATLNTIRNVMQTFLKL